MKIAAYLFLFIGGVFFFSGLSILNHQQTVSASDLTDPTLPVVCIDVNGNKVDRMPGFTMEMDARNMRNVLIPMTTRRTVTISIKAYKNTIRSVAYEVSAPDTGRVIENAKIGNFQADGDYQTASFTLSEPILMNREYPIRFTVQTDAESVYYYARIIQRSDPVTDKYVQFVYDFYEGCTNQQGASDLNTYLETDETIANNSYTSVNIKSTLRQVTWGSLHPQIYRKAIPVIRDINGETCTITNDYLISTEGDHGQEIYHVHEYYRLRYYNAKMMLLNFTRKALQIMNPESGAHVTTAGVNLGVAERDVTYVTNETSDVVAFIQDNELWEFSQSGEKLSRVFSLHDTGNQTDERYDNTDYGIRIVRVSEGGGMDFIVYGYMSRGEHEGQMGVSVCHYNPESTAVTELSFVPYTRSFEQLRDDVNRLSYVNREGTSYLYLARSLYKVEPGSTTAEAVLKDIHPDCLVSSSDMNMCAWMNEMDPDSSQKITVMDLDSGKERQITAEKEQYLRALGFLNDDFFYGVADFPDITTDASGARTFAMKELRIEAFDGEVIKTYHQDGVWVTEAKMEPGLAQLTRVTKTDEGSYVPIGDDNIINNLQKTGGKVSVALGNSSRQGTTVTLKYTDTVINLNPTITDFRIVYTIDQDVSVPIPEEDDFEMYYVYGGGDLLAVLTDPAKAVTMADANVGTVLNQEWQYIYERGNKQTKEELSNEDIPEAFLSGESDADKLASRVGEGITVINLTGCTLEQVLYQVSQGRAVVTKLADGSTSVIVGYDRYNTKLYNFDTGEHYYFGMNDSTASMLEGGNVFVTYIEKQATIKEER